MGNIFSPPFYGGLFFHSAALKVRSSGKQMRSRNIQVSNYFSPVHLQPFMAERFGYKPGDFPVTESVSKSTIALPFYNNLTKNQVAIVCKTLKEVL